MAWALPVAAGISALPSLFEKMWPGKDSKERYEQIPTMTGGQRGLLDQLMGSLGGQGGQMGGPMGQGMDYLSQILGGDTEAFEQPLMRQYQQELIPQLAERFSGAGAGAQGSSAFQQAGAAEASGLSERLGAMRGQMRMGAMSPLLQMLQTGMGAQPFATRIVPGRGGFGASMAQPMGQMAGLLGQYGMQQQGQQGQMDMLTKIMQMMGNR